MGKGQRVDERLTWHPQYPNPDSTNACITRVSNNNNLEDTRHMSDTPKYVPKFSIEFWLIRHWKTVGR